MTAANIENWIGRTESVTDIIDEGPLARFEAVFDTPTPEIAAGSPLPPGAHWIYFLNRAPQAEIGPDGHPARGSFMPPVELPRRMFAGARYEFHAPLRVGETVNRRSEITAVAEKSGRSGALVFVTVRHEYENADGVAITEENDIVYREESKPGDSAPPPKPAPADAIWRREITPDPVLLFRYSAITFNSHRIHYDRTYCQTEEGYPGLVVHGPLVASFLMDLCRRERPGKALTKFSFRAMSPLFDTAAFTLCGAPNGDAWDLWAANNEGGLSMQAKAEFAA